MGDLFTQAKTARETLARALGALQSDPTVPPGLMAVAEPVAQAMGALHAIERSAPNVNLATAPLARDHIRAALGMLQTQGSGHAAVTTATEAVATSLGVVFGLVRAGEAATAGGAPPAEQAPAFVPPQPAPQAAAAFPPAQAGYQQPPQQHAPPQPEAHQQQQHQQQQNQQQHQQQQQQQQQQPPHQQPPPQQHQQPPPQQHQQPPPQQHQPAPQAAAPQAAAPQAAAAQPQAAAPKPASAAPPGGATRFDAPLGTSSNSNFYKGLAGNDVVEHGGLFIATYAKVPPIGAPVSLHVVLPGGYEFEAMAVIAWTRESASGDAVPGFGARFTQIAPESRQLIYRYVRNREPLFHDDF